MSAARPARSRQGVGKGLALAMAVGALFALGAPWIAGGAPRPESGASGDLARGRGVATLSLAWWRGQREAIRSPEEAAAAVKRAFPEVAEVPTCPGGRIGCQGDIRVRPGERKGDWRVVVWEGWEDCPAGCIDNRWRYFVVKRDGAVSEVGRYERIYDAATNEFQRTGEPRWGDPPRP